ncbi:hypothetical protein [Halorussus halophilus]|uniref:hypothetical protein n=1 Tax=Halorussus halophilus TaxID=2650975 RepID=UPI001300F6FC|nr:hypothetical protein [Halorussus halophilus]
MAGRSSNLCVYTKKDYSDVVDIALQAFEAVGFETERRNEEFDEEIPSMNIPYGNKSFNISITLGGNLNPHEPVLTMSFKDWLNPSNWEYDEKYEQFFDDCIGLVCRLATGFSADYVPVCTRIQRAEVLPLEPPLADHIDQISQLGVYSQSLLAEFGGLSGLFEESRWEYSQPPWRVGELDNGSLLVITHPRPWTDVGWTESSHVDLRPGEEYIWAIHRIQGFGGMLLNQI